MPTASERRLAFAGFRTLARWAGLGCGETRAHAQVVDLTMRGSELRRCLSAVAPCTIRPCPSRAHRSVLRLPAGHNREVVYPHRTCQLEWSSELCRDHYHHYTTYYVFIPSYHPRPPNLSTPSPFPAVVLSYDGRQHEHAVPTGPQGPPAPQVPFTIALAINGGCVGAGERSVVSQATAPVSTHPSRRRSSAEADVEWIHHTRAQDEWAYGGANDEWPCCGACSGKDGSHDQ